MLREAGVAGFAVMSPSFEGSDVCRDVVLMRAAINRLKTLFSSFLDVLSLGYSAMDSEWWRRSRSNDFGSVDLSKLWSISMLCRIRDRLTDMSFGRKSVIFIG